MEQVRRQGYAIDRDELLEGASCLACPVQDYTGVVVGAISTSMRTSRFIDWDESLLAKRLKLAALDVYQPVLSARGNHGNPRHPSADRPPRA